MSDILERVFPGLLLILAFHFFWFPGRAPEYYDKNVVALAIIGVLAACPIGVALNLLARVVPGANRRSHCDLVNDTSLDHIASAFQDFFKIVPTHEAWRYCYGIVSKYGYSVNMELFQRLDIFGRSMMVGSIIILLEVIARYFLGFLVVDFLTLSADAALIVAVFVVSFKGSQTYSKAFTHCIYEGFYSWYVDIKFPRL